MPTSQRRITLFTALFTLFTVFSTAQSKPRARDLGVPFDGDPGAWNAITDVKGVEVGHTTLISGEGALKVGVGPVRTGVTAILPRGKDSNDAVFGGWFTENGSGEMTGTTWLEDSGFVDGPVMITNTHSVGVVHDAVIAWKVKSGMRDEEGYWWSAPVVAETWDGDLNDVNGFHVKPEHVFHAIDTAHSGPVEEGNVGGGTGMICHEFKGGIGTASLLPRLPHRALDLRANRGRGLPLRARAGIARRRRRATQCCCGRRTVPNGSSRSGDACCAAPSWFRSIRFRRLSLLARVAQQVNAKLLVYSEAIAAPGLGVPSLAIESLCETIAATFAHALRFAVRLLARMRWKLSLRPARPPNRAEW